MKNEENHIFFNVCNFKLIFFPPLIALPSPSGRAQKHAEASGLQPSQTFGQRIMGNMMDNLLLRNLTSKSRSRPSDVLVPSSPVKVIVQVIFKLFTQVENFSPINSIKLLWDAEFIFFLGSFWPSQLLASSSFMFQLLKK